MADRERVHLLEQAETEHDPEKLAEVHERLLAIDAYRAPARAAIILSGLGLRRGGAAPPMQILLRRLADARGRSPRALATQPDLLLLDEPTNHLDLEAALWLEGFSQDLPPPPSC